MGDRPVDAADHTRGLGRRVMDRCCGRRARRLAARGHPDRGQLAARVAGDPAGGSSRPLCGAGAANRGARLAGGCTQHCGSSRPTLDLLDSVAIVVGGLRVSILTVVKGVLSLAMLLWAATVASNLFERRITRVSEITPRARVLLGKLIKATLVTLAVVLSLTSIGVDLTTFALFTGALGVGVGLGLQRTVSNLFSGIVLLLDKSIKPGDVIEVGGTYGWVSSLGARYVSVETRDGTEFLIPNEDIITHQVVNWSHKSDRVRLKIPVRVPHDSDLDQALALMREAASYPDRVLAVPTPNALIIAFGETAIELELRFWIEDAQNGVHNIKSQVLYEIWRLFRQEGIQIPYPKRDLYVRSDLRT